MSTYDSPDTEFITRSDSLEADSLPLKYKITFVLILYLFFLVMGQTIIIYLIIWADNDFPDYYFFLGFGLLFFLGVMTMMILTMISFHINDRIEEGQPYFNDKESYRYMMLTASFFFFLLILSIIGFSVFTFRDWEVFRLIFVFGTLGTVFAWILGYLRKKIKTK